MVFEKSRAIIFYVADIWQRANFVSGTDAYFKSLEDKKSRDLEKDIEGMEKEIEKLNKKLSELKEKTKTDKSAKNEFEKIKEEIKDKSNELKNKQKSFSKINQGVKKKKQDFIEKYKNITKIFSEISKFKMNLAKQKEDLKNIIRFVGVLNIFKELEPIFPFEKLVNYCNLDLKIENEETTRKVQNLNLFIILMLESIACNIFDTVLTEKLNSVKILQMKHVCQLFLSTLEISSSENISQEYFEAMLNFSKSQYSFCLGVQAIEEHRYTKGTQFMLKAKEYLEKSNKNIPIEEVELNEYFYKISAHASDSYNLIYLLNSYINWKNLMTSKDSEIREIAEISKKNIEEWITKQFGFPKEEDILKILKNIRWPQTVNPKEIQDLKGVF
ncbi:MAG: hypothetical protein EAX96_01530 [Candidatus Lokiarchaeota archaeon]|nr:hypothetical protein [Candidatus Lokiarchaeota archaeon]